MDTFSHLSPSYFLSREFRITAKRHWSVSAGYLNLKAIERPSLAMVCENSDKRGTNPWWMGRDTRKRGIPGTVPIVSNGLPLAGSTEPMYVPLILSFPGFPSNFHTKKVLSKNA